MNEIWKHHGHFYKEYNFFLDIPGAAKIFHCVEIVRKNIKIFILIK